MRNIAIYQQLNNSKTFREFQVAYNYPKMHLNSYKRILHGESTYIRRGSSPYIADVFRFISKKFNKPYVLVAYDLLDREFFGRKNTLEDVLISELGISEEDAKSILQYDTKPLANIRLCDLTTDLTKLYNNIKSNIEERM